MKKLIDNVKTTRKYKLFLEMAILKMYELLPNGVKESPVKYSIVLKALYIVLCTENVENKAFKNVSFFRKII